MTFERKPQVINPEQLEELISDLLGTCRSIPECLPTGITEDDLTEADHNEIDQRIFRCDICQWWFELSDEGQTSEAEVRICEDCE